MFIHLRTAAALAAALVATVGGCGSKSDLPETVPVSGTITYNTEPVPQGTITFLSAEGHTATGTIQPDGSYRLGTFAAEDGAVPGQHRVMIVADTADPTLIPGSSPGYEPPKELIPPKYKDASTSGLVADVSRENSEINFDLE
ncbi:hypothetical protein [Tautonia rosea]|uniref:hypothetical protein n=1 Tax=Tautonia rosea TaxID=2728037 RepID=UPI001472B9B6|nr:hypothetical protein [Tautonia rosea]